MAHSVDGILNKVFVHPESGATYGRIRRCAPGRELRSIPEGWTSFADDECGNAFVIETAEAVAFWDHETAELTPLAESWQAFVDGCEVPEPVKLRPGQVRSAWIDPELLQAMGRKPGSKT